MFVNMILFIRRSKNFAFIYIINTQGFQYLRFDKMPYTALGHNRNSYGIHNLLNNLGIRHACYTAGSPDIRRYSFQGHYRHRTCRFSDFSLLGAGNIHDNPAFFYPGHLFFNPKCTFLYHINQPPAILKNLADFGLRFITVIFYYTKKQLTSFNFYI